MTAKQLNAPALKAHCSVDRSREEEEDLTTNLKSILIFGRIIGVIPYNGVMEGKFKALTFRWKSLGTITNLLISLFMAANVILGVVGFSKKGDRNAFDVASNAQYAIGYSIVLCTYLFFLLNPTKFFHILQSWKEVKFHYQLKDVHLKRDVNIIVFCVFTSIAGENISWHFKQAARVGQDLDNNNNSTANKTTDVIELFYIRGAPVVASVLPYHPIFMLIIFITNKFGIHAREYGDVFLIVISRCIYMKFKLLVEAAEKEKVALQNNPSKWKHLVEDFNKLLELLNLFAQYLSPLVFLSFSTNVYYMSLRLCVALQPQENISFIDRLYANWSFVHGITRFYLVVLSTAKINEHALSMRFVLAKCPQELYSLMIQRFEYQINHNVIGLNGFGCFIITKSIMMDVIGVIFTIEILLLQSLSPPSSPANNCDNNNCNCNYK